jgi:hypothetical protein
MNRRRRAAAQHHGHVDKQTPGDQPHQQYYQEAAPTRPIVLLNHGWYRSNSANTTPTTTTSDAHTRQPQQNAGPSSVSSSSSRGRSQRQVVHSPQHEERQNQASVASSIPTDFNVRSAQHHQQQQYWMLQQQQLQQLQQRQQLDPLGSLPSSSVLTLYPNLQMETKMLLLHRQQELDRKQRELSLLHLYQMQQLHVQSANLPRHNKNNNNNNNNEHQHLNVRTHCALPTVAPILSHGVNCSLLEQLTTQAHNTASRLASLEQLLRNTSSSSSSSSIGINTTRPNKVETPPVWRKRKSAFPVHSNIPVTAHVDNNHPSLRNDNIDNYNDKWNDKQTNDIVAAKPKKKQVDVDVSRFITGEICFPQILYDILESEADRVQKMKMESRLIKSPSPTKRLRSSDHTTTTAAAATTTTATTTTTAIHDSHVAIMSWRSHGRAFQIHQLDHILHNVLPQVLDQPDGVVSFENFLMILKTYGIRQFTKGRDESSYFHKVR